MFSSEFWELFKNTYIVEDLQTAGSEAPVSGSLLNKVASLTAWKHLTVLERDSSTGISLWIFVNILGKLFCRTPPSNHFSHVFFSSCRSTRFAACQSVWWSDDKLGEGIQALSILRSFGNQMETSLWSCGHTCADLGILIAGEMEEKEELKILLNFPFMSW